MKSFYQHSLMNLLSLLLTFGFLLLAEAGVADETNSDPSRQIAGAQDFSKQYLESIVDEKAHEQAISEQQMADHAQALRNMEHGHRAVGH
jgi:hypothetical protein